RRAEVACSVVDESCRVCAVAAFARAAAVVGSCAVIMCRPFSKARAGRQGQNTTLRFEIKRNVAKAMLAQARRRLSAALAVIRVRCGAACTGPPDNGVVDEAGRSDRCSDRVPWWCARCGLAQMHLGVPTTGGLACRAGPRLPRSRVAGRQAKATMPL